MYCGYPPQYVPLFALVVYNKTRFMDIGRTRDDYYTCMPTMQVS